MNQQDKRTQRDYILAFKLAVVDQVERGEMTYKKAQERGSPPLTPDQRIKELEQQLKEATLKADLLESMLDIIRTEYGVSLSKKPLRAFEQKKSARAACLGRMPSSASVGRQYTNNMGSPAR